MRGIIAVLLAVLIIGVTPAVAAEYSEISQTVDLTTVKGKGAAESAVQMLENGSTGTVENSTVETVNTATGHKMIENNASVASADEQVTAVDPQLPNDSLENNNVLENDTTENITIPQKDTTGIVMQSTNYTCGPAALATVLQNLGINETEQELMVLAGTGESGTTLYGLVQAAQSKGLSAAGMKLPVDELKANHIVHVILDGTPHYSVVRKVTENSVYLADPSLGNIVMTREKFNEIYTGHALVISDPKLAVLPVDSSIQTNETSEQTNSTVDAVENQTLTTEEMLCIKGQQLSATASTSGTSQILTSEEMQTIRGKVIWKVIAAQAAWGAVAGVAIYAMTTPRDQWTWQGAGSAALIGAVSNVIGGGVLGKAGTKMGKWLKHRKSGQRTLDRWMKRRR